MSRRREAIARENNKELIYQRGRGGLGPRDSSRTTPLAVLTIHRQDVNTMKLPYKPKLAPTKFMGIKCAQLQSTSL